MKTMRDFLNIFESVELDEAGAGPSRIVNHIHHGAIFIMISAMRGNLKHSENLRRTEKLKHMLSGLPVSFIETEGEYHEAGREEPSPEKSFFIMPKRDKEHVDLEIFKNLGIKMMHTFQQDSILFGDGEMVSLIFSDGNTMEVGDTLTFRPEIIDTLGGFSKIKGRKFSFTDAPDAASQKSQASQAFPTKGTPYKKKNVA